MTQASNADNCSTNHDDQELLYGVIAAANSAGARLAAIFARDARPCSRSEMLAAGARNELAALTGLRERLAALHPDARWVEQDQETSELPLGEWWAVDAVEGNVNHIHGLGEWCVSITLLRDNAVVLTVVRQPIGDLTYTALRGGGAFLNGASLGVSAKTALDAAIVATGQAEAGQAGTHRRIGDSITAMLGQALLVRCTVPSTFPMLLVASGQNDVFWQYSPVLPGIAGGILLVSEAGGTISQIDGSPWRPGSHDVLVATPALHAASVRVLASLSTEQGRS